MKLVKNNIFINLVLGDLTEFEGDAIVNPANRFLFMGGGVAGAIKKRGGKEIEDEARKYTPIEIGQAIATSAGKLRCKAVIHAPTVEVPGGSSNQSYVYKATLAALKLARERGFKSIAFPLMGAGVGGLSIEESIEAMAKAFQEVGQGLELYIYVLNHETFEKVVEKLRKSGWSEEFDPHIAHI
jgi:O-acetyl-ADP-ribose deacetylase (regulator of RNase III)